MEAARRPCAWRWSRAGAVAASPGAAVDVVIRTALAGAAASVITLRVGAARFRASSGRPSRPTKCNLSGPISLWCRNLHGCSDATSAHHLPPQKDVPCRQARAGAQSSGAAPTSELCVTRGAAWRHGCSAATSRNRSVTRSSRRAPGSRRLLSEYGGVQRQNCMLILRVLEQPCAR